MIDDLTKKLKLASFKKIALIRASKDEYPTMNFCEEFCDDTKKLDLAIAYSYSLPEMKEILYNCWNKNVIQTGGCIYILYPKLKNKLHHTPIHRDDIFPYLKVNDQTGYLPDTHLKFQRMLSLDDSYTLLSLKNSPQIKRNYAKKSSRVDDYLSYLPEIEFF